MSGFKPRALWVSVLFGAGLIVTYLGERALDDTMYTWIGLALVLGSTALRGALMAGASGKLKNVQRLLLLCQVGALAALGLYFLGTQAGAGMLGITEQKSVAKWHTVVSVLWPIAMGISLIPLAMIEISLGQLRIDTGKLRLFMDQQAAGGADVVELHKVRETAGSGLTIALAMAFLMVTCNVAEQRDVRKDVSYFKTSAPGGSTIAIARALNEPVTVYLFFDEVSEVADQVEAYFRQLASEASGKIVVERSDRLIAPALVKELKVSTDGTIVLKRGDKNEKFTVATDFAKARRDDLRELDGKAQKALMKVLRAKRVAYFSVGHGELNNTQTAIDATVSPDAKSTLMKQLMGMLNYEVKDFDGLGKPVPDDCSILFVLAPRNLFLDEELRAIDEYLARGGSLFMALPVGEPFELGPLAGRLGLKFEPVQVASDKPEDHARRQGNASDNVLLRTNQFASHASVTTLNRAGVGAAVLIPDTGHLVDAPLGASTAKRTYVVRSSANSYADANGNFLQDEGEKRERLNLVAAVEDPNAKPEKAVEGQPYDGMRAVVFAGGALFWDGMLAHRQLGANRVLVEDAVRWLGGEEEFAGETVSEKDVAIEHTKSEDAKWFYATLAGAPILVLGLGLGSLSWRRRRAQRRRS